MLWHTTKKSTFERTKLEVVWVQGVGAGITNPNRPFFPAVRSAMAKQERITISERTRAGIARVRRQGVKIGRPPIDTRQNNIVASRQGSGRLNQVQSLSTIVRE